MIEQILDYIHNYFVKEVYRGNFSIEDGNINVDFLQEGQYFKVVGSVFNDGVFKYPSSNLEAESFKGEVWALAIPPSLVSLASEIGDWQNKYGAISSSPYQSESFGGYSYSKNSAGNSQTANTSWQTVFASRLNHWRKIS